MTLANPYQKQKTGDLLKFDPALDYTDYTEVTKYVKIEKARREIERRKVQNLVAERYMPLGQFCKEAWHIVEPGKKYIHNWHIDAICDHLMAVTKGDIQNLIINVPPRHMKSLTVSVFWFAWTWTILPSWQFIYAAYSQGLSTRDSIRCRRLVGSAWFQSRWGEMFHILKDQNQKTRFENNQGGYRLATSVGGSSTGEGGNVIVVDDPHNMKEIHSDIRRGDALDWWDTVMSTRTNNPETDHRVIIAQRGHENDLTGHLQEKMKNVEIGDEPQHYEMLILPAEYEPRLVSLPDGSFQKPKTVLGFQDPRTEEGELLYPQRFPKSVIIPLKNSLGAYATSAQLQQSPSPAGGSIFKIENFRCWAPARLIDQLGPAVFKDRNNQPITVETIILPPDNAISDGQSWDLSFEQFGITSFVVGQVWRQVGTNFFLLHQEKQRLDFVKTVRSIKRVTQQFPNARTKLVEKKANGHAVISSLKDQILGIVPITPTESKISRAYAISPVADAGSIVVPHPSIRSWSQGYVGSMSVFPFGKDDDEVDATTQYINHVFFGPKITIS